MNNQDISKNTDDELLKLLKRGIEKAIRTFYKNDSYLIAKNLHEMAITHRIAVYLGEIFSEYHVDCEWDKDGAYEKYITIGELIGTIERKIEGMKRENDFEECFVVRLENLCHLLKKSKTTQVKNTFSEQGEEEKQEEKEAMFSLNIDNSIDIITLKKLRPDIIIHRRGKDENIAVMEIKKGTNSNSAKTNVDNDFDLVKLYKLTTQGNIKYQYGFFIELPKNIDKKEILFCESKLLNLIYNNGIKKIFEVRFTDKG